MKGRKWGKKRKHLELGLIFTAEFEFMLQTSPSVPENMVMHPV